MLHIPRLYLLSDICGSGRYIPPTPEGVRIGKLWAVAETDLVDFLRAAGVRIEDDGATSTAPAPDSRDNEQQRVTKRRPGRPRKPVEF